MGAPTAATTKTSESESLDERHSIVGRATFDHRTSGLGPGESTDCHHHAGGIIVEATQSPQEVFSIPETLLTTSARFRHHLRVRRIPKRKSRLNPSPPPSHHSQIMRTVPCTAIHHFTPALQVRVEFLFSMGCGSSFSEFSLRGCRLLAMRGFERTVGCGGYYTISSM